MTPEDAVSQLPNYRRIEIWVAVGAILFIVLLIEAIRRRRLKERYALLWFPLVAAVIVLTVKRDWLEALSFTLGVHHVPSALLLVLVGLVMVILFHFSTVVSGLLDDRNVLAQRLGILDARCQALKLEVADLRAGGGPGKGNGEGEDSAG